MPTADYELPTFFQRAQAGSLTAPGWYVDQQLVAPTVEGSSFTLLDSDGRTVIAARAITIEDDVAVVAILVDDFDDWTLPQRPFRELWDLVINGKTERVEREALLCRVSPQPHVTEKKITDRHPSWRSLKPQGVPTLTDQIDAAWGILCRRLLSAEILPNQILDSWKLFDLHILRTMQLHAFALSETGGSNERWSKIADKYEKEYEGLWTELFVKQDTDDDGLEDGQRQTAAQPQLFMTNVPTMVPDGTGWFES